MTEEYIYGVVVGRFQIDVPHEGHKYLLDHVSANSSYLIIVLGTGPLPTSGRKPLPFETRAAILQEEYPNARIFELHDHPDDKVWSENLDKLLGAQYGFMSSLALFHSRDSFKQYYSGVFDTVEVPEADIGQSATLHRKRIAASPGIDPAFARGVIWANENRFPTVYGTVDGAVIKVVNNLPHLLVITKEGREGLLFPGGFCEPGSTDEEDVVREIKEECNIDATLVEYICSMRVDDWRYSGEKDEIRTRLFLLQDYNNNDPVAGDDAEKAFYISLDVLESKDFNKCHQPLADVFLKYWKANRTHILNERY